MPRGNLQCYFRIVISYNKHKTCAEHASRLEVEMKLLFAVVQDDDAKGLTRALIEEKISVTRIASTGGFLHGGNTTLMIGVDESLLEKTLSIIQDKSRRRQVVTVPSSGIPHSVDSIAMPLSITVGGATVFILDVADFKKF